MKPVGLRRRLILLLAGISTFCCACGQDEKMSVSLVEVLVYLGFDSDSSLAFQIEESTDYRDGLVSITETERSDSTDRRSYKIEYRQNQLLVATRFVSVTPSGLFLDGEQVQAGSQIVSREYQNPIQLIPYPLVDKQGQWLQSWTSDSQLSEGGVESHRFDNAGPDSHQVPAGVFESFHLIHTTTRADRAIHQSNEYFAPQHGYVQFDLPSGRIWSRSLTF